MKTQPIRYQIYMREGSRVWLEYKTAKGFYKQLHYLASLKTLKFVHVYVPCLDNWYEVEFNLPDGTNWKSRSLFEGR